MSAPTPIDPNLLRARLTQAVQPLAPSPDALRQIRAGIRRRRLRRSFGTGAGALLVTGGAVAMALAFGSPGNPQTAPVTAEPGQTTATTAPDSPTPAPTTTPAPQTSLAPTSGAVPVLPTTAPASPVLSSPALSTPAALVPALAGKKDFGHALAVVDTNGGPCLSVNRLVELSGAAATAWVAKHPNDAAINDLGVIADEDGPSPVCLPLSSKPTIRLPVNPPPHQGIAMHAATLDQLRHVLADPSYFDVAPHWFADFFFYRLHYDTKGAVDQVTGWWTP